MDRNKLVYYVVIAVLALLYYVANATGFDYLAMLIILPVGYWVMLKLNPEKPT